MNINYTPFSDKKEEKRVYDRHARYLLRKRPSQSEWMKLDGDRRWRWIAGDSERALAKTIKSYHRKVENLQCQHGAGI